MLQTSKDYNSWSLNTIVSFEGFKPVETNVDGM